MNSKVNYDSKGRVCKQCKEYKLYSFFHKHKNCVNGYNTVCKECRKPLSKAQWGKKSLEYKIWHRAKSRARKKNINFNIDVSDIIIPTICPVLYIKNFTPSIDKINPDLGYIKNNVRIISNRANMLKNNATIKEMELVLTDLKKSYKQKIWKNGV